MNHYLCLNCADDKGIPGKKFWSDTAKCSCGVDATVPELASYLKKLVLMHYDPPHPVLHGRGTNKKLCDGQSVHTLVPAKESYTGDPSCVTCPLCKAHAKFPANVDVPHVVSDGDYVV